MELRKKALKRYSKNELIDVILVQEKLTKTQAQQIKTQAEQIKTQAELTKTQAEQITGLKERIARLEKDSKTSSKPPSKDKDNSNRNQSLRGKSGKPRGGQKGHKGQTREQVLNPDTVIHCYPNDLCESCGNKLDVLDSKLLEKRQKVEIPKIKPKVMEYQKMGMNCSCGHCNKGAFPEDIKAPVQIGKEMKSFLIYLNVVQLIPFQRLTQLTQDLFNFSLSKRTIENALEDAKNKGYPLYKKIMEVVKNNKWTGSDETGVKVSGARWWEWVWQNEQASYYAVNKSRGYNVVKEHFGEDYEGTLCHDCWSAHNNTVAKSGHQQCHPHLQRDLKFLVETYKSKWAYTFNSFLSSAQKARDKIWASDFDPELRKKIMAGYQKKLESFLVKASVQKDILRLQKRVIKHRNSLLLFMSDPDIPFHNNSSESAIRVFKVKQKISGCFRSEHGAERYSVLLSIIETAKKQNLNILASIQSLLNGTLSFQGC